MLDSDYTSGETPDQDSPDSQWVTAWALVNEPSPPIQWLVADLLPLVGLSLLAAKPKVGKSTLARSMSVAVAQGVPWLGRKVQQGRVLYINLEEHRARVAEHFRKFQINDTDELLLRFGPPSENGIVWLKKQLEEYKPALVIVDPMIDLVSVKDISEYAAVARALGQFLNLAHSFGTHICLVHHNNKGVDQNQGLEILGSTALLGRVDCAILLSRDNDKRRSLYTIQRDGTDIDPPVELLMNANGGLSIGRNVSTIKSDEIADEILEVLQSEPNPVDMKTIRDAVGHKYQQVAKTLKKLVTDAKIVKSGTGKSGQPYLFEIA